MILVKTPVRITFFGGGSDYPAYFKKKKGRTLGLAINKYSYIAVNKSPIFSEKKFFIGYSKVEKVNKISLIKHPSVKACLKYLSLEKERLQIHYFADLPAKTGLGSSSAFTVSLLKALYKFKKIKLSNFEIAKHAIKIEQEIIKENVGCQDQITTSLGGLLDIKYLKKNNFEINKNFISKNKITRLCSNLIIFYSGIDRYASDVLKSQLKKIKKGKNDLILEQMVKFCEKGISILKSKKNFDEIGNMLNENWNLKKKLSNNVSNKKIDKIYNLALKNGAIGGKIVGAGSGGFFLFYVPKKYQRNFKKKLNFLKQVEFEPDYHGCRFI